jgi:hypothetical protein
MCRQRCCSSQISYIVGAPLVLEAADQVTPFFCPPRRSADDVTTIGQARERHDADPDRDHGEDDHGQQREWIVRRGALALAFNRHRLGRLNYVMERSLTKISKYGSESLGSSVATVPCWAPSTVHVVAFRSPCSAMAEGCRWQRSGRYQLRRYSFFKPLIFHS